ncbi:PTS sugar transporter subunit IIA [Lacticaseibacillus daqingensis]|uniref:PTS sugar transporter subunit IIA n=1 Tax=Lacticaseibacillus daqingensis TaxID=2486014 RepID=UPI000F7A43C7|nr:PTS glucose transporter subunit IIA [Lacticaseibacillus daqingensis]
MFNFFKKSKTTLVAPVSGEAIPMTQVADAMFSQKMMGDGFGVRPEEDALFAPAAGTIASVFPTKHAYTMTTVSGIEILVHLGVDTVELKGAPFTLTIEAGQEVAAGDAIGTMDRALIKEAGKADDVIVVITNMDAIKAFTPVTPGAVTHGDEVLALAGA